MVAGGNVQCIKIDNERKNKNQFYAHLQKTSNAVFKNGFNPVLNSIPRLLFQIEYNFFMIKKISLKLPKIYYVNILLKKNKMSENYLTES